MEVLHHLLLFVLLLSCRVIVCSSQNDSSLPGIPPDNTTMIVLVDIVLPGEIANLPISDQVGLVALLIAWVGEGYNDINSNNVYNNNNILLLAIAF